MHVLSFRKLLRLRITPFNKVIHRFLHNRKERRPVPYSILIHPESQQLCLSQRRCRHPDTRIPFCPPLSFTTLFLPTLPVSFLFIRILSRSLWFQLCHEHLQLIQFFHNSSNLFIILHICFSATLHFCRFAYLQVCMSAPLQIYKSAYQHLCNSSYLRICIFASLQCCFSAPLPFYKSALLQICVQT